MSDQVEILETGDLNAIQFMPTAASASMGLARCSRTV